MKVTKEMLHPDLQSSYWMLSIFTWFFKKRWFMEFMDKMGRRGTQGKDIEGLECDERMIASSDGRYQIRTRIYRPKDNQANLPVMLYIHGGGYITGSPESSAAIIERFIETRPCVVIAPDYRKAFEEPFPAGFNDCYDVLLWAKANASELGTMSENFMIAGHSAGGGLTAAVTLKVRDSKDADIAFQMPIYPMIDDQQPNDPDRYMETVVWDTELNTIGWGAYLSGLKASGEDIPAYAAPARNTDHSEFPPTITFVGNREPFHQETLNYVSDLEAAGIEVAFKEYDGCYHAFDMFGKGVGEDAQNFTFDQYASFYDRFVVGNTPS